MGRGNRALILAVCLLVAFWLIWSRLRFVVLVRASFGQLLLLFVIIGIVLFLGIEHLINRTRH